MADRAKTIRRTGSASIRRILGAGIVAGCAVTGAARAQDVTDTPLVIFDFATGLRFEDRTGAPEEFSLDTRLGAGYFTATASRRFSIEARILAQTLEDEDFLTDPALALSYAIFDRETEISFDLDYTGTDLEDAAIEDDFDPEDITDDAGRRDRADLRLGLVTGRESPFGTESELRYRWTEYSEGSTLDDEVLASAASTLRFTLDPLAVFRLGGFYSVRDIEDAENTLETVHRLGIGADLQFDRVWSASLDLGYREIATETDVLGVRVREVVDGAELGLLLTRDMRNGALSFSINRDVIDTGFRDTLRLRRSLTLANGAEVAGSIGAVRFEGADPIAIYSASYANEIRRGSRLSLLLDRSGGVTDDDENVLRTRLTAGLAQDLTRTSSISFDTTLSLVEDAGLVGDDSARLDLALAYRLALTADWNLAARATHRIDYEDGVEDDRVTTLSLGVERRFSFRP